MVDTKDIVSKCPSLLTINTTGRNTMGQGMLFPISSKRYCGITNCVQPHDKWVTRIGVDNEEHLFKVKSHSVC